MSNVKENRLLNEKLVCAELTSGMKCFIIPKKGYKEKQAVICTKYGSLDNVFSVNGKNYEMPYGIAHFLEHKLFEERNENIFNTFTKNGGDCNAFTNFTTTAYYFNCIDNFHKNFKTLLRFTSSMYLTDGSVEKEKGIITQEINMYNDDPQWISYFNMLRGLYLNHPARIDIAGTEESINKINKEMLMDCFDTFYSPDNMAIVVAGDVDIDETIAIANKYYKKREKTKVKKDYGTEPKNAAKDYIEKNMKVSMPIFHIGFKENNFSGNNVPVSKILLDIICGKSSHLYNKLYNQGLIDNNFGSDYMGNNYFGTSVISGNSNNPKKVAEEFLNEVSRVKNEGVDRNTFERIKKKYIGINIRSFNSINHSAVSQVDCFIRDTDIISDFEQYVNIDYDSVNERLKEHLITECMSLSVVK